MTTLRDKFLQQTSDLKQQEQNNEEKIKPTVLTVYFSGTGQRIDNREGLAGVLFANTQHNGSNQLTHGFDGCKITDGNIAGGIFAVGLDGQCRQIVKKVKELKKKGKVIVNCYGHSRGALAALLLAKMLGKYKVDEIETNLVLVDPVPGNLPLTTKIDFLDISLASRAMDLSSCKNLKRALSLYPCWPTKFEVAGNSLSQQLINNMVERAHAPLIPSYPKNTILEEDVILGYHSDNQEMTSMRVIDFLIGCGTKFKEGFVINSEPAVLKKLYEKEYADLTTYRSYVININNFFDSEKLEKKQKLNEVLQERNLSDKNIHIYVTDFKNEHGIYLYLRKDRADWQKGGLFKTENLKKWIPDFKAEDNLFRELTLEEIQIIAPNIYCIQERLEYLKFQSGKKISKTYHSHRQLEVVAVLNKEFLNKHHQELVKGKNAHPEDYILALRPIPGIIASIKRNRYLYRLLKWLVLGVIIATILYFTGGLAIIPFIAKMGALSILAATPFASLAWSICLHAIIRPLIKGILRLSYYVCRHDNPGKPGVSDNPSLSTESGCSSRCSLDRLSRTQGQSPSADLVLEQKTLKSDPIESSKIIVILETASPKDNTDTDDHEALSNPPDSQRSNAEKTKESSVTTIGFFVDRNTNNKKEGATPKVLPHKKIRSKL